MNKMKKYLFGKSLDVLKLASNGLKAEAIASELNININTVKYHKKRIFEKLNVLNIAEAIEIANKIGLM